MFDLLKCDPAGTRTQGPNIKSVVLYQLSYEINLLRHLSVLGVQKYKDQGLGPKVFGVIINKLREDWLVGGRV
jgi:hypothetical protein